MTEYKDLKGTLEFFCFWEVGKIGVNVYDREGRLIPLDITLEDAKRLLGQLHSSIDTFENMERVCKAYMGKEEE